MSLDGAKKRFLGLASVKEEGRCYSDDPIIQDKLDRAKIHLQIGRDRNGFVADVPAWCGSPAVGRGRTMDAALGAWLRCHQELLGIFINSAPSVSRVEMLRRKRELAKR